MKKFLITLFVFLFIISIYFCVSKPKMHKKFSMNVIEYIMKINSNGNIETVETVTTTEVK